MGFQMKTKMKMCHIYFALKMRAFCNLQRQLLASRTIHDGYRCNYLDALMRLYGQERALSPNTL